MEPPRHEDTKKTAKTPPTPFRCSVGPLHRASGRLTQGQALQRVWKAMLSILSIFILSKLLSSVFTWQLEVQFEELTSGGQGAILSSSNMKRISIVVNSKHMSRLLSLLLVEEGRPNMPRIP